MDTNRISATMDQNDRVHVLTLSGDLCREEAVNLIEKLVRALANADYLVIQMKDIGWIDPYFLSQICTAYKISLRLKKKIIVTGDLHRIREFVSEARGTVCTTNLLPICSGQCLWRMKERPADMTGETA